MDKPTFLRRNARRQARQDFAAECELESWQNDYLSGVYGESLSISFITASRVCKERPLFLKIAKRNKCLESAAEINERRGEHTDFLAFAMIFPYFSSHLRIFLPFLHAPLIFLIFRPFMH